MIFRISFMLFCVRSSYGLSSSRVARQWCIFDVKESCRRWRAVLWFVHRGVLLLTSISVCFIIYSEFNLVEKLSHPSTDFCLGLLRYEGYRILTAQEIWSTYFSQTDHCTRVCVWAPDCYIQGVPGGMDKTSGECSLC